MNYSLGVDIGSTTAKAVLINGNGEILYSTYERHYSKVLEKCRELLQNVFSITGTALLTLPFRGQQGLASVKQSVCPLYRRLFPRVRL